MMSFKRLKRASDDSYIKSQLNNTFAYDDTKMFVHLFNKFQQEDPTFQDRFFNTEDFADVMDKLQDEADANSKWQDALEKIGEYEGDW